MEIGELNKRITLQKFTTIINENGFNEDTWPDIATMWSKVSNLFGREYFAAAAVQAERTVKFTIRYLKELDQNINLEGTNTTKAFRIKYGNLFYNLTFIDDIKSEHKLMEIKAMLEVI